MTSYGIDYRSDGAPWNVSTARDALEYLSTVMLGAHLERLPAALRESYVNEVAAALRGEDGRMTIDYVRLNLDATAAPA